MADGKIYENEEEIGLIYAGEESWGIAGTAGKEKSKP